MRKIKDKILIGMRAAEASISQSEGDRIQIIWSTGSRGLRKDDDGFVYYEELEMTETACDLSALRDGAPFVVQHEPNVFVQVGALESASIENGIGKGVVILSSRAEMEGYRKDIKKNVLNKLSVGYIVDEYTPVGFDGDIPILRATKWRPVEVSIVSIGFDPYAKILRSNNNQITEAIVRKENNDMNFAAMTDEQKKAHVEAKQKNGEELTVEEQAWLDSQSKDKATPPKPEDDSAKIEEGKRQAKEEIKVRTGKIRTACRAAGYTQEQIDALIDSDKPFEKISEEIFKDMETRNKPNNKNKESTKMTIKEQVADALLNRLSSKHKVDRSNPFKQAKLIDMIHALVPRNSGESDSAFAQRAIGTADLAELLANVAGKALVDSQGEKFTFDKIAEEYPLRDFKENSIVELSISGLGDKDDEDGDYPSGILKDTGEKIQLRDRGALFILTYKAIVNDDLKALKKLPEKAKKLGFKDIEKAVIGVVNTSPVMSDTKALFHADHGNLIADGDIPSVEMMDEVQQLMRAFKDDEGETMDLSVRYLLVPPKYETAAKKVAAAIVADSAENVNPFGGQVEVLVSSRLLKVAGKDAWYALCDKDDHAALVYGVMEGQGTNTEVAVEADFNSKNQKMRVTLPNNAAPASSKGIIRVIVNPTP